MLLASAHPQSIIINFCLGTRNRSHIEDGFFLVISKYNNSSVLFTPVTMFCYLECFP